MNRQRFTTTALATACLAFACGLAAPLALAAKPVRNPDSGTATTYTGRAIGIQASLKTPLLPAIALNVADTGELDPAGGMRDAALAVVATPQPLQVDTGVVTAVTVGSGTGTDSSAATTTLELNLAQLLSVDAGVLQSNAVATCVNGAPVYSGSANIADLVIQGNAIPITGERNQTISLLGLATIIINEQIQDGGRFIVNALHVKLGGALTLGITADVVISQSVAGINCASVVTCPVRDFMTGGGYITLPSGEKGTFGFVGGQKANGLQGHLQYNDHGGGPIVRGDAVTAYSGTGTARSIGYRCTVGGTDSTCQLGVADNGTPGGGVDAFALTGGNYSANGPVITKGNIRLHVPNCPTASGGGKGGGRPKT